MRYKKLCLIGGMGSGKSSLSRRYSALVGGTAVDTDKEFTRRYGDISAFFARYGEREFRKREEQIMIDAASSDACVIATGGGAVLNKRGMYALRKSCDIVWLTAPIEVLRKRIANSDRPLKNDIVEIMKEREPLYERYADYIIDTTDDSLRELKAALLSPRRSRYDIVLCDADDTLLDFSAAYARSIRNTVKRLGLNVDVERAVAEYKQINDDLWRGLERGDIDRKTLMTARVRMFADKLGAVIDTDEFNETYLSEMMTTRFTVSGATEFCDKCRAAGAKLYVVTNSSAKMATERLKALDGHIDGYFISEEIGYDKPDARFFDAVFGCIGQVEKTRTVIFGDSETSDIKGGANCGIDTCLFDRHGLSAGKNSAADYKVKSYEEFLKLL